MGALPVPVLEHTGTPSLRVPRRILAVVRPGHGCSAGLPLRPSLTSGGAHTGFYPARRFPYAVNSTWGRPHTHTHLKRLCQHVHVHVHVHVCMST